MNRDNTRVVTLYILFLLFFLPQVASGQTKEPIASAIAWKPDGSVFAVGYDDGTLEIRNRSDGSLVRELTSPIDSVYLLVWHPTANQLISDGAGQLLLWNLDTGTFFDLASISDANYLLIRSANWNGNTSQIIAAEDLYFFTWDVLTSPPQFLSRKHSDMLIFGMVWNPARDVVAVRELGDIILRDSFELRERKDWAGIGGDGALAWSPDGQWLAAGDWMSGVYAWKVSTGQFEQKRTIHAPLFANARSSNQQHHCPAIYARWNATAEYQWQPIIHPF